MTRFLAALLLVLPLAACNEDGDTGYQGYVEGEYLRIAAPDAGWITTIAAIRGRQVEAGAPLFALDPARESAAVAQAEAELDRARSDLADMRLGARPEEIAAIEAQIAEAEANQHLADLTLARQTELVRTRSTPQAQLDTAQMQQQQALAQVARMRAQLAAARLPSRPDRIRAAEAMVESARHALEQARWRLAQRQIASPAAGLVDDVVRRPGEWVPANGVVVSLLPPTNIRSHRRSG
jgi:HlyD family secretion protein